MRAMPTTRFHRLAAAILGFALFVSLPSSAGAEEKPQPPVTKVKLREMPKLAKSGKVAIYRGEADETGVAFYIEGLGIGVPVGVILVSEDPSSGMKLAVKNDLSKDWDRKVEPKDGYAEALFRTEGPAMALVTSPGGMKPYRLFVWVGPEIKFHKYMAGPFVTNEEYEKSQGGGLMVPLIAGGAVLLGLVLIAVVMVRRSRRRQPR
jgi:hypothetical protein